MCRGIAVIVWEEGEGRLHSLCTGASSHDELCHQVPILAEGDLEPYRFELYYPCSLHYDRSKNPLGAGLFQEQPPWMVWEEATKAAHPFWAKHSTKQLQRADLSGADLSRADLSGADLSEADLSRANLSGADLSEANLIEANLSEANLIGANLIGAYFSEADLIEANLSRANLSRANLSRANLFGANLSRADLSEADLSRANLSKTTMPDGSHHK